MGIATNHLLLVFLFYGSQLAQCAEPFWAFDLRSFQDIDSKGYGTRDHLGNGVESNGMKRCTLRYCCPNDLNCCWSLTCCDDKRSIPMFKCFRPF